jgi:hypothetical protein
MSHATVYRYRNGSSLLGALAFFVDNMDTFVFTSIEDTLETWEEWVTLLLLLPISLSPEHDMSRLAMPIH